MVRVAGDGRDGDGKKRNEKTGQRLVLQSPGFWVGGVTGCQGCPRDGGSRDSELPKPVRPFLKASGFMTLGTGKEIAGYPWMSQSPDYFSDPRWHNH